MISILLTPERTHYQTSFKQSMQYKRNTTNALKGKKKQSSSDSYNPELSSSEELKNVIKVTDYMRLKLIVLIEEYD